MSKIAFELFGSEVEVVGAVNDSEYELMLELPESTTGFVRIGDLAERLESGVCVFDLRLLENGEYTPELFLDNSRIALPKITKTGCLIEIKDCTAEYMRAASQRERALRSLVGTLEEKIALLEEKVYGTTIL
ncbi:MAG: hypothetical protein J6K85_01970 [Clostridia bacterium]|nr:hypothetical protein [Clostridia bacterium]